MKFRQLAPFARQLHIQAAPTHSPLAPQLSTVVPPQQSSPLYTTLGQPSSLLQLSLTPSLPVYIQRNSLLSLSPLANVYTTPYWLSPLKRILLGWHQWRFHKLESTVPASALVKAGTGKSLYVLSMDGKEDFAVFPRSSLLSFAGPALRVETSRVPLKVSRTQSGKWFGKSTEQKDTGLARMLGYSLLQGRGDAVLQGEGEVYKLVLNVDEDVIVKRDSLVGVSITGDLDCIESWSLRSQTQVSEKPVETEVVTEVESTDLVTVTPWTQVKSTLTKAWKSIQRLSRGIFTLISPSGSGYVKITGPRTVLIQSGTKSSLFGSLTQLIKTGETISVTEQKIHREAQNYKTEDVLSYATVKDGKVTFHSTPDFNATVEKIEQAGKKE